MLKSKTICKINKLNSQIGRGAIKNKATTQGGRLYFCSREIYFSLRTMRSLIRAFLPVRLRR